MCKNYYHMYWNFSQEMSMFPLLNIYMTSYQIQNHRFQLLKRWKIFQQGQRMKFKCPKKWNRTTLKHYIMLFNSWRSKWGESISSLVDILLLYKSFSRMRINLCSKIWLGIYEKVMSEYKFVSEVERYSILPKNYPPLFTVTSG